MTLYEQATKRIDDTPELEPYRDLLLYDWTEGDEHLQWVINAELSDILDWAEVNFIAEHAQQEFEKERGK